MSRQQVLAPRPVDVNVLVRRIEGRVRSVFPPAATITITTGRTAHVAHVDVEELEQTLIHLATHAAGSMGASGTFDVVVERARLDVARPGVPDEVPAGEYVAIRVSHSGVSPAAPEPELVQPFAGAETASLGTGLAMATVHGFMLESAGALAFESREGGVAYSLYFPVTTLPTPRDAAVEAAALSAGGKRTVLLAEDEPTVRLLMKRVLERAGYAVLVANDGEEALEIARAYGSSIDALVTDVIMPGMGGGELSRRMRADRPSIRVLHVSGYTAGALRHHEALDDGAAFLQKPFTAATLASKLKEVLAK
jgi:CheY-like chemotaxis protein